MTAEPSVQPIGLVGRIVGVIFSPRKTYTAVAAQPTVVGVFAVTLCISGVLAFWLFSSEQGQRALLSQVASRGQEMTAQQQQGVEIFVKIFGYVVAIGQIVFAPLALALLAVILKSILNFVYGMPASFRQVYAVVVHSTVIMTVVSLFATPLMFVKEDLVSPTRLAVLLPMLPEQGFITALCNSVDLWMIWWLSNLAIGLAVLYKRHTAGIAGTFLGLYGCIALIAATVRSSFN